MFYSGRGGGFLPGEDSAAQAEGQQQAKGDRRGGFGDSGNGNGASIKSKIEAAIACVIWSTRIGVGYEGVSSRHLTRLMPMALFLMSRVITTMCSRPAWLPIKGRRCHERL